MAGIIAKTVKAIRIALGGKGEPLPTPTKSKSADMFGVGPERIAQAIQGALKGNWKAYHDVCAIFDRYLLTDAHLLSEYEKRRQAVIAWPWRVLASEDDDKLGDEIAGGLAKMLRNVTRFRRSVLWELTDAIGKGFAAVELFGELDEKNRVAITGVRGMPQAALKQDKAGDWHYLDDGGNWHPVPPGKVLIYDRPAQGSLMRGGLMFPLIWYALFKNFTIKDWIVFLETYGVPLRIGKYPARFDENDPQVDLLERAVIDVASNAGVVIPEGMTIEFVEAAKAGTSEAFEMFVSYVDKAISKLLVGGTLTSDAGEKGSRSLGDVHQGALDELAGNDAQDLAEALDGLLRQIVELNYGPRPGYPTFEFRTSPDSALTKALFIVQGIVNMGGRVPTRHVFDLFGIPEADGDEPVLEPAPTMQNPTGEQNADLIAAEALGAPASFEDAFLRANQRRAPFTRQPAGRVVTRYNADVGAYEAAPAPLKFSDAHAFIDGITDAGIGYLADVNRAFFRAVEGQYEAFAIKRAAFEKRLAGGAVDADEVPPQFEVEQLPPEALAIASEYRAQFADALAPGVLAGVLAGVQITLDENRARLRPGEHIDAGAVIDNVLSNMAASAAGVAFEARTAHAGATLPSLSGTTGRDVSALAALVLDDDGTLDISFTDEGFVEWHKVKPEAAAKWWAKRAGVTSSQFDSLADGAKRYAFTVAGVEEKNVIKAASQAIGEALEGGDDARTFARKVQSAAKRAGVDPLGNYHLRLVYHQNVNTALSAARFASQRAPEMMRVFPMLKYHAVHDGRERAGHRELHDTTLPAKHEFWSQYYPPWDFFCRCWVSSAREQAQVAPSRYPPVRPAFEGSNPLSYWRQNIQQEAA